MFKPNTGRVLSAVGAGLLIVALFIVWYHIERSPVEGDTTATAWTMFPRLRMILLVGAVLTLASAIPRQTGVVLIARTLLGLLLAALIARRIIDPPELSAPVQPQAGVYVALAAALCVAAGGLVDTGRRVVAASSGLGRGGDGGRALPAGPPTGPSGEGDAVVRVPNEASRSR
jgi:tellurite resistance protein TehA-like permease